MKVKLMKNIMFFEFDKEGGEETTTEGGIVIPEVKDTFIRTVTLAGENEIGVKAGDKVLLSPHTSLIEYRIGMKWYKMCSTSMVVAILID